jgi:hypothetical protein
MKSHRPNEEIDKNMLIFNGILPSIPNINIYIN